MESALSGVSGKLFIVELAVKNKWWKENSGNYLLVSKITDRGRDLHLKPLSLKLCQNSSDFSFYFISCCHSDFEHFLSSSRTPVGTNNPDKHISNTMDILMKALSFLGDYMIFEPTEIAFEIDCFFFYLENWKNKFLAKFLSSPCQHGISKSPMVFKKNTIKIKIFSRSRAVEVPFNQISTLFRD